MCTALYVGSFDPFTNGHLNVLDHASKIFDTVYISVMTNPQKKRFIPVEDAENIINRIIYDRYENVVLYYAHTNLAYKQAKECECDYLIRGIRNNGYDYQFEENYAEINKGFGGIDTIFIRADQYKNISSTLIRAMIDNHEDISNYVPPQVYNYLKEKLIC